MLEERERESFICTSRVLKSRKHPVPALALNFITIKTCSTVGDMTETSADSSISDTARDKRGGGTRSSSTSAIFIDTGATLARLWQCLLNLIEVQSLGKVYPRGRRVHVGFDMFAFPQNAPNIAWFISMQFDFNLSSMQSIGCL